VGCVDDAAPTALGCALEAPVAAAVGCALAGGARLRPCDGCSLEAAEAAEGWSVTGTGSGSTWPWACVGCAVVAKVEDGCGDAAWAADGMDDGCTGKGCVDGADDGCSITACSARRPWMYGMYVGSSSRSRAVAWGRLRQIGMPGTTTKVGKDVGWCEGAGDGALATGVTGLADVGDCVGGMLTGGGGKTTNVGWDDGAWGGATEDGLMLGGGVVGLKKGTFRPFVGKLLG